MAVGFKFQKGCFYTDGLPLHNTKVIVLNVQSQYSYATLNSKLYYTPYCMLNTPSPSQNSFENSVTKRKKICHLPNIPRPNTCLQLLGTSLTKTVTLPVQFSPPHPDKGQILLPGKAFPSTSLLPGHRKWSSARCSPRRGGEGMLKFQFDRHITTILFILMAMIW